MQGSYHASLRLLEGLEQTKLETWQSKFCPRYLIPIKKYPIVIN